jgi:hypothetical protein
MGHRDIARALADGLRGIRQEINAIRENQQAADNQPKQQPPIEIRSELTLPVAVSEYCEAENKDRKSKWRKIRTGAEIFGVACAFVLAFLTLLTLREIRTQTASVKKSADAAETSANAAKSAAETASEALGDSRKSFVIEQRPYLTAEIPVFVRAPAADQLPIRVTVYAKNIGRTPAIKHRTFLDVRRFTPSRNTDRFFNFIEQAFVGLRKQANVSSGKYAAFVRRDVAPGATPFNTGEDPTPWTTEELQSLRSGALVLFVTGLFQYTDGFNVAYETEFCYFYFGATPTTWHICDSHNTIQ